MVDVDLYYEKNLVINNRELKYKGIFRADELFHKINSLLEELGYTKREKKTEELVTDAGRRTYIELRPFKEKTNYVILMIKMRITLDHITETFEEVKGVKKKFQSGDVDIYFDAWILSDYQHRWGMKPVVFFLKGVINKYLYTWPLEAGFKSEIGADTARLFSGLKALFSSYKVEAGKYVPESEIKRQVEEEIMKEVNERAE